MPVDLSAVTSLALAVEPKIKDRNTGEVAIDANGVQKWTVSVFLNEAQASDSGMVRVTVVSAEEPALTLGQPLQFSGLRVMHWEAGSRSGMAWSADSVVTPSARRGGASE